MPIWPSHPKKYLIGSYPDSKHGKSRLEIPTCAFEPFPYSSKPASPQIAAAIPAYVSIIVMTPWDCLMLPDTTKLQAKNW
jgi:hypothetical protein